MKTIAIVLAGSFLLGQAAQPVYVNEQSKLIWTHDGKDVKGQPETLASGEVALYAAGVDPKAPDAVPLGTIPATDPKGTDPTALKALLLNRADGDYVVAVRVADAAGNRSAPEALLVRKDTAAPSPISGLKATITFTITVP